MVTEDRRLRAHAPRDAPLNPPDYDRTVTGARREVFKKWVNLYFPENYFKCRHSPLVASEPTAVHSRQRCTAPVDKWIGPINGPS